MNVPKYRIEVDWLNTHTMEYESTYEYAYYADERDFRCQLFIGDEVAEQVRWCRIFADGSRSSYVYVKQDTDTEYLIRADKAKGVFMSYAEIVHGRIELRERVITLLNKPEYDIVKWCVGNRKHELSQYKIEKGAEYNDINS